ncbi:response regulator [Candidatus Woesearchaeota archaeon]|nr:response regulator [Candidatus Woesearchaeota archaeon]
MDKKQVLVVDDEPHIVHLISLSLNKDKYEVIPAYSAREAQYLLEKQTPDIVVLDLMMPGMNGYEFCELLKHNPGTKDTPVLILSAKSQMHDKLEAIEVGADDYLTKPFDPMELIRRIKLNLNLVA